MVGYWNYTVILTYLSLVSGTVGIILTSTGNPKSIWAAIGLLLFSGLCDSFDGIVARTKKDRTDNEKSFGIQIDSLSDIVAFGVLPAMIMFAIVSNSSILGSNKYLFIPLAALFVLCGLVRLAFFNVIAEEGKADGPVKFYWGLPISMSSIILPIIFGVEVIIEKIANVEFFTYGFIFAIFTLIVGIMFVLKVKVPKLHLKGMMVLCSIGLIIFVSVIILYINFVK